jgi:neutral ceramidase
MGNRISPCHVRTHLNLARVWNIRNTVRAKLISSGVLDNSAYVVIAGPSNVYSHYVTTREEYTVQRYEGASTLYGPRA